MWRSVSTGTDACTATARAESTSPPTGPAEVAPTSTPRSASTTSLMKAFVAGLVNPAACRRRHLRDADNHATVLLSRLGLGEPNRADLGIGERHPRQRPVVGRRPRLAEDVAHRDVRLVHRDVGERAVAGHVADGPDPVAGPHPFVHRDELGAGIQAGSVEPEPAEFGLPAGGDQQPLAIHVEPSARVTREARSVMAHRCRRDAGTDR